MILYVFTVFDSKVGQAIPPFFAQSQAAGLRQFNYNCNREDSDFNRYPGDYTLFELGVFETESMCFQMHETPTNHGLSLQQLNETEIPHGEEIRVARQTGS